MKRAGRFLLVLSGVFLVGSIATLVQAEVVIDTVTVGNPGNAGELAGECAGGRGPDAIVGGVEYVYEIGMFEVTAAQYTEFLIAVAATDTYGLYNEHLMWILGNGCRIERTGSPGSWSYTVAADWAERPVNAVSWGDAVRFANWLHNGQPSGSQDLSTTEDGSYFLDGAVTDEELLAVTRKPNATWVIPTEDEWYKAAHHKNDGVTGDYFDYAASDDFPPSNDLIDPDPGNNATFYQGSYTIGAPYYRTEVGEHENSSSPYETFDQCGNVAEWTETIIDSVRDIAGGGYTSAVTDMRAAVRGGSSATYETPGHGFRVARVQKVTCSVMDTDDDGDIDLIDFAVFQNCLGGPVK